MLNFLQSPYLILYVGYFCLLVAFALSWNMWKTRKLVRSAVFVKAEFALLGVLLLMFIRDMCSYYDVRITWLFIYLQWVYTPLIQLVLSIAVLYLILYVREKYKRQKLI